MRILIVYRHDISVIGSDSVEMMRRLAFDVHAVAPASAAEAPIWKVCGGAIWTKTEDEIANRIRRSDTILASIDDEFKRKLAETMTLDLYARVTCTRHIARSYEQLNGLPEYTIWSDGMPFDIYNDRVYGERVGISADRASYVPVPNYSHVWSIVNPNAITRVSVTILDVRYC